MTDVWARQFAEFWTCLCPLGIAERCKLESLGFLSASYGMNKISPLFVVSEEIDKKLIRTI